jgi:hypothetical protein
MNPANWKARIKFLKVKRFICYSPAYLFHEGIQDELRANINKELSYHLSNLILG